MTQTTLQPPISDPTWDVVSLYPNQGEWTEADYFLLPGNRLIELNDGQLEVLPLAIIEHQIVVSELNDYFKAFVKENDLGLVLFAPMPIRLWSGQIREPDIVYLSHDRREATEGQCWNGADLALEVVSENDPDRDWAVKRGEYAKAGIPEYWIVDPRDQTIAVLTLPDGESEYREAGRYAAGDSAASVLLEGFAVDISAVFAAK